ncbi:hypothetical protein EON65_46150, partial [archaeon]
MVYIPNRHRVATIPVSLTHSIESSPSLTSPPLIPNLLNSHHQNHRAMVTCPNRVFVEDIAVCNTRHWKIFMSHLSSLSTIISPFTFPFRFT